MLCLEIITIALDLKRAFIQFVTPLTSFAEFENAQAEGLNTGCAARTYP